MRTFTRVLSRSAAVAAAVGVFVGGGALSSAAQPVDPDPAPGSSGSSLGSSWDVGSSAGPNGSSTGSLGHDPESGNVALGATVTAQGIEYTVVNVPSRSVLGQTIQGECTTLLVDAVLAWGVVSPQLDEILAGDVDVVALLAELNAKGAVLSSQLRTASGGVAGGEFVDVERGAYVLLTNCTITLDGFNPDRFDYDGVLVFGDGLGSSGGSAVGPFGS